MKRLYFDIETSPNVVFRFEKLSQPAYAGVNQLIEPTRMLCVAWHWEGETWEDSDNPRTHFAAEWGPGGRKGMLKRIAEALNQADVVVHYNGALFDVPHLNREFIEHGIEIPSPYMTVDLWRAVSKKFALPSNKLEYVVEWLGLPNKIRTGGFDLWRDLLIGDLAQRTEAKQKMEMYNRRDVEVMPLVYDKLRTMIPGLPNAGLFEDDGEYRCPGCGSLEVSKDGLAYTAASVFQRYRCKECGKYSRGWKRTNTTPLRRMD